MLRFLSTIVLLLSVTLLSGCYPIKDTASNYTPPKGSAGKYCVLRCKKAFNSCMQICGLKDSTCRDELKENATQNYEAYKASRRRKGWRIRKKYSDFYRNATCEHSCNCVPAYNTCYRACGGSVT